MTNEFVSGWRAKVVPWRPSLLAVPRHEFLPHTVWIDNVEGGPPAFVPLRREQDPDRWLRLAYADDGVVTQVDDGRPKGPGAGGSMPSSSASRPVMVAVMLAALDACKGHRVLEVGTGTGCYNAALLAHQLGAEQVTSIEINPDIVTLARKALSDTGFGAVRVITGEGALGYPPGAPYDRVIVTAACHHIPYVWAAQTRPGGQIVMPRANTYTGGLVALTVTEDGTASGRIVAESNFMWLREQRGMRGAVRPTTGNGVKDPERIDARVTTLHPSNVTGPHGTRMAIDQRVPGCQWRYWPWQPQSRSVCSGWWTPGSINQTEERR